MTNSGWIHQSAGAAAPLEYLFALLVLALPVCAIVITCRSTIVAEGLDLGGLARERNSAGYSYAVSWLLIGGSLALTAALCLAAGKSLGAILSALLISEVPAPWIGALLGLALALKHSARSLSERSLFQTLPVAGALAVLAVFAVRLAGQSADWEVLLPGEPTSPFRVASLVAIVLWGFVLTQRKTPVASRSRPFSAVTFLFALPVVVFALISAVWVRFGSQQGEWILDQLPAETPLDLTARVAAALLLLGTASLAARFLLDEAQRFFESKALPWTSPNRSGLLLLIVPLSLFFPLSYLSGAASGLLCIGLALALLAKRRPKQPLMAIAATVALLLPLLLPGHSFALAVAWAVPGLALWLLYARREFSLGTESFGTGSQVTGSRVASTLRSPHTIIAFSHSLPDAEALQLAMGIRQDADRPALLVRLLTNDELGIESEEQELEKVRLETEALARQLGDAAPETTVLRCSTRERGAFEALHLGDPSTLVLIGDLDQEWIERALATIEVDMVVIPAQLSAPDVIAVAAGGGVNEALSLSVADRLRSATGKPVKPLVVNTPDLNPVETDKRVARVTNALRLASDEKVSLGEAPSSATGLEEMIGNRPTLLILGAAVDPLVERPMIGELPRTLAENLSETLALVITKSRAGNQISWVGRTVDALSRPFKTLTRADRTLVAQRMRSASTAGVDFYTLLLLAAFIATLGLARDSSATVIGAMLVAPLMSPILALAHGLVLGNPHLMHRAFVSSARGAGAAMVVGLGVAAALENANPTNEMLARGAPNLLDLAIAMASGAAAAYATSYRSVAGALPGVAISVALVPPLCVAGWAFGSGELALAGGAFLLFLTNFCGIIMVASITFVLVGVRPSRRREHRTVGSAWRLAIAALLVISIPLGLQSRGEFVERRLETVARSTIRDLDPTIELEEFEARPQGSGYYVSALIRGTEDQTTPVLQVLYDTLRDTVNGDVVFDAKIDVAKTIRFPAEGEGPSGDDSQPLD